MSKFNFKGLMSEFFSLDNLGKIANNATTTTHKAVIKPNRQTMAFLLSEIRQNQHIYALLGCFFFYVGLIGVNTKPKGNSPSRLYAVVETQRLFLAFSLTKHKGGYHA